MADAVTLRSGHVAPILRPGYRPRIAGAHPHPTHPDVPKFIDSRHFSAATRSFGSLPVRTANFPIVLAAGLMSIDQAFGLCTDAMAVNMLACRAALSGQPLVNCSSLYGYYWQRFPNNAGPDSGGSVPGGLASICKPGTLNPQYIQGPAGGACAEYLWPMDLGAAPPLTDNDPYKAAALAMVPGPAVLADAAYHYIENFALIDWNISAEATLAIKTALAAGYPVGCATSIHALTLIDFDDSLSIYVAINSEGNNAPQPGPFAIEYSSVAAGFVGEFFTVTDVHSEVGPTLTITQDQESQVQAIVGSLIGANGMPSITLAAANQLLALANSIVGGTAAPPPIITPPPPPPTTTPPPSSNPWPADGGLVIPTNSTNLKDSAAHVWTMSGKYAQVDGKQAADGTGVMLWMSGGVATLCGGDVRYCYRWNGTGWTQGW